MMTKPGLTLPGDILTNLKTRLGKKIDHIPKNGRLLY